MRQPATPPVGEASAGDPAGVFEQWRAAERAARAAEFQLWVGFIQALERKGHVPTLAQGARAVGLRHRADGLLKQTMDEMDSEIAAAAEARSGPRRGRD